MRLHEARPLTEAEAGGTEQSRADQRPESSPHLGERRRGRLPFSFRFPHEPVEVFHLIGEGSARQPARNQNLYWLLEIPYSLERKWLPQVNRRVAFTQESDAGQRRILTGNVATT